MRPQDAAAQADSAGPAGVLAFPEAQAVAGSGLPLPGLGRPKRSTRARYALTTSDRQGRLADRSPILALSWPPLQPVSITATQDTVVIPAVAEGRGSLTRQGFLQLPAAIRYRCHIRTGDRLLIAAYPDRDRVVVYTLAALDDMINTRAGDLP